MRTRDGRAAGRCGQGCPSAPHRRLGLPISSSRSRRAGGEVGVLGPGETPPYPPPPRGPRTCRVAPPVYIAVAISGGGGGLGSRQRRCPTAYVTLPHRRDWVPTSGCLRSQLPRLLTIPKPHQGASEREIPLCLCVSVARALGLRAKWLHWPYDLGGPQSGGGIKKAMQLLPSWRSQTGKDSQESKWIHNPCLLGAPKLERNQYGCTTLIVLGALEWGGTKVTFLFFCPAQQVQQFQ